jgi:polyhydroxyalkanoate synthase subunit PhaC
MTRPTPLAAIDALRRAAGAWLDVVGLGPVETPARRIGAGPAHEVLAYGAAGQRDDPRVVLLVPAPIKQAYIWDLAPQVSVVRRCRNRGFRVYLLRWLEPREATPGLGYYASEAFEDALRTIEAETGEPRAVLAGHSLGGTLAAIFAALRPERVRALVLLEAPLAFGPAGSGAFAPLLASAPPARAITEALGRVPGSFLDIVSVTAAPVAFVVERWLDRLRSASDPEALVIHQRVERWALDEMPMSRQLFEDVVETLYREDRFMRGSLAVAGRPATPDRVSAPLLAVVDPRSRVVPPESTLPFLDAAAGDATVLYYDGERGVSLQHVGVLVGRAAHARLWPRILDWMAARE